MVEEQGFFNGLEGKLKPFSLKEMNLTQNIKRIVLKSKFDNKVKDFSVNCQQREYSDSYGDSYSDYADSYGPYVDDE